MSRRFYSLQEAIEISITRLRMIGEIVDTGHWQGVPTEGKPDLQTKELLDLDFDCRTVPRHMTNIADILDYWRDRVKPNIPWADDHFAERVSRVPSNPGEQYKNWPWWHDQEAVTAAAMVDPQSPEFAPANFKFDHTYQERFWPKGAGHLPWPSVAAERFPNKGIRYDYGDLDDVVNLLLKEPHTRQAYLPIFFPEDTGAVHGGRIPCTLGYHFMLRDNQLHMWYTIRSCDVVRHFRDDVYLALRLLLWVIEECKDREQGNYGDHFLWSDIRPGIFHFKAFSFHVHMGDYHLL